MKNGRRILLVRDKKTVCGRAAEYKLIKDLKRKDEYLIGVFYCKDKAIHRVSGKLSDVAMIYELAVRNAVTPCTLGDVIEDISYEK